MTAPTLLRPPAVPAGGASSEWLSKELKRTEEAQERLNRRRGRQSQGMAGQVNQTREVAAAAIPLRAPSMVREMADLELATEYAAFLRRRPQGMEIGAGVADDDVLTLRITQRFESRTQSRGRLSTKLLTSDVELRSSRKKGGGTEGAGGSSERTLGSFRQPGTGGLSPKTQLVTYLDDRWRVIRDDGSVSVYRRR